MFSNLELSPVDEREKSRGGSSSTLTSTPAPTLNSTSTPTQGRRLLRDDARRRERDEHIRRNRRSTGRLTHHNLVHDSTPRHDTGGRHDTGAVGRLGLPSGVSKPVHKSASASSLTLLIPAHG